MASLLNTKISNTYVGLIKTLDNAVISSSLKELSDGSGNATGIHINNAGDLKVTNILEFGSLKDTGENITISKFVDAADGIGSNNNDTTIPTSAAVATYVAAQITLEDLDFSGDSGTGSVDLDSQVFAVVGTANEIETSAGSQQLQIGLPNNVTISGNLQVNGLLKGNNNIVIKDTSDRTMAAFYGGDKVELYFNDSKKFETTSGGVTVTGGLTATGGSVFTGATFSGNIVLDDNLGASPQIQFINGNNDTGEILLNSSGKLEISTGGTDRLIISSGDTEFTGDISLPDEVKLRVGSSNDLEIYHDSNNSYIQDTGTGGLRITSDVLRVLDTTNAEVMIKAEANAGVELYHDNSKKLETTSGGINVLGGATFSDNITMNASTLNIIGTYPRINLTDTNNNDDFSIINNDGSFAIFNVTDSIFSLLIDTTNNAAFAGDVSLIDSKSIKLGTGSDLEIFHDGSNSFIENSTGIFNISQKLDDGVIKFNCDDGSGSTTRYIQIDGSVEKTFFFKDTRHEDNVKAEFGSSGDLEIYHDGSNSYIQDTGTGDLIITGSSNIQLKSAGDEFYMIANADAQVALYYNGIKKFETSSIGVDVTGSVTTNTGSGSAILGSHLDLGDNQKARFGASQDLQIYHNGSNSFIQDSGTGELRILASTLSVRNSGDTELMITAIEDGAVNLYHDNSKKFETTSTGVSVTGNVVASGDGSFAGGDITIGGSAAKISGTSGGQVSVNYNTTSNQPFIFYGGGSSEQFKVTNTGDVTIAGSTTIAGDLTVNGTTTTVNTSTLAVEDPLISLAKDNSANSVDIGFYGRYNDGSNRYLGLFADASDSNTFNLFKGTTTEPTTTVDTTATGYERANLNVGNLNTVGSLSITADGSNAATLTESGSGDFTIASVDDMRLTSGGNDIVLRGASAAEFGRLSNDNQNFEIKNITSNKDINIIGNDGGSTITALSLDMSEGGQATFNRGINASTSTAGGWGLQLNTSNGDNMLISVKDTGTGGGAHGKIATSDGNIFIDSSHEIQLDSGSGTFRLIDGGTEFAKISENSNNLRIFSSISNGDILLQGNDGGTTITALQLDMSNGGDATFAGNINFGDSHFIGDDGNDNLLLQGSSGESVIVNSQVAINLRTNNGTDALSLDSSQNATFAGNIDLPSAKYIRWGAGDAQIEEGATANYSLDFSTYDGSSMTTALTLLGNNNATFAGTISSTDLTTVNKSNSGAQGGSLLLRNAAGGAGAHNRIYFAPTSSSYTTRSCIIEGQNADGNNNMALIFKTSNGADPNERYRIDSSGHTFRSHTGSGQALDLRLHSTNTSGFGSTYAVKSTIRSVVDDSSNAHNSKLQFFVNNTSGNLTNVFTLQESSATFGGQISVTGDGLISGDLGIGATGIYTSAISLNIDGSGLAIKNNVNGSNNNWSYIHNTATSSSSNLVFATGNSLTALTLAHNGDATFDGAVGVGVTGGSNAKLEVASTSGEVFRADASGGAFRIVANQTGVSTQGTFSHSNGNATFANTAPLTPIIKAKSNQLNGYTFLGDNYASDESQVTIGIQYSSAGLVLGQGVKPSNDTNNKYLSTQDTYANKSSALVMAGGDFKFKNTSTSATTTTNTEVSLSERMRISNDGRLFLGTALGNIGAAQLSLQTDGGRGYGFNDTSGNSGTKANIFHSQATEVGSISINSSSTAYNTSSDYRLKEDLKDFAGLDMVSKIPVYDFKWKADDYRGYGVMAHELEEVLPQAVTGEKDAEDMQGVDYSKIVPLLVKSIQELKKEVDTLKKECKCN